MPLQKSSLQVVLDGLVLRYQTSLQSQYHPMCWASTLPFRITSSQANAPSPVYSNGTCVNNNTTVYKPWKAQLCVSTTTKCVIFAALLCACTRSTSKWEALKTKHEGASLGQQNRGGEEESREKTISYWSGGSGPSCCERHNSWFRHYTFDNLYGE